MTDTPDISAWPKGRVGYIALLGRPNTGKSTFLNALLGYHLSAVSSKPQTTRRRWLGVLSDAESQLLFLDCPGVHLSRNRLDEAMEASIRRALQEADVVLCLFDATRALGDEDRLTARLARETAKKARQFVVLTKADLLEPAALTAAREFAATELPGVPLHVVSAVSGEGVQTLLAAVRSALPEGPFLYSPETMTNAMERQIAADLIREAALEKLRQEVPHALAVTLDRYEEKPNAVAIQAVLHLERESQKGIVIGAGGQALEAIRLLAIKKLREIIDLPVRLKLHVKVDQNWRDNAAKLKEFDLVDSLPGTGRD